MQEYDEDGNEVIDFLEFYRVRAKKYINADYASRFVADFRYKIKMYQTFQDEAIQFPELELRHTLKNLETNDKKLTKGHGFPN